VFTNNQLGAYLTTSMVLSQLIAGSPEGIALTGAPAFLGPLAGLQRAPLVMLSIDAVAAMLDRLLHHALVLKCGPKSWRTKLSTTSPLQEARTNR